MTLRSEINQPAVLVTGAGQRIGQAVALDLAANGWAIAVHCNRSRRAADALVAEISAGGGRAVTIAADLLDEDDTATLVPRAAEALGPLTGIVNNASVFEYDTVETATRESWDLHMQVNARAPLVLIQSFMRQLPAGEAGCIINMLDQRVWNLTPHFTSYTVSKMALWTLTQTLAMALAPQVRVNAVGPGPTLPSTRQSSEHFRRQWSNAPLARAVGLEDICSAVRFLFASPAVTGQMIAVDSGQHLGWSRDRDGKGAEE